MKLSILYLISLLLLSHISLGNTLPQKLNSDCPASFEKTETGKCELRSLYDLYDSPAQHGGFRVNLPRLGRSYSAEQIDLGRYLFFDPVLSKNKDLSCASCHQLENGLSDGRARSISALDKNGKRGELSRATPTLWNIAFHDKFMWDGRADSLSAQALLPLFSEKEMGTTPDELTENLNAIPKYIKWFEQAFSQKPNVNNTARALAAFQTSLISLNSPYDRYVHGDESALNETEIKGYNSFRGFVGRCTQCHVPPLFTDGELAVIGSPKADGLSIDKGAGALSKNPSLLGAFRVPTLRNINKTAPYFHAGQLEDLSAVLGFYNNTRGHMAPEGQKLDIHWHVHMTKGSQLSEQDEKNIIAFLATLSDETLLPKKPITVPSGLDVN